MTPLSIHLDCQQQPLELDQLVADGSLTAIGLLRHGTEQGKASVAVVVTLADGTQVLGQTTWALLRAAVGAMAASPAAAEEVVDP